MIPATPPPAAAASAPAGPGAGARRRARSGRSIATTLVVHAVAGRGGRGGGPVSLAGFAGVPEGWHEAHLRRRRLAREGPWAEAYGEIEADDVEALTEHLRGRFGGSALAEAKIAFHRLGCRGCHKIDGVGGDEGADLSSIGRRLAADLDFGGVRGEKTTANWLAEHLRDPVRVVPGSRMPDFGLAAPDIERLNVYMFSLRELDVPAKLWPPDRVRTARLGEREFATDGETLFGVFCAACHGADGTGREFGSLPIAFPAVARPGFLALASDAYLVRTLERGRPGRMMPPWGTKDGGLRPAEVDALVTWLRARAPEDREALAEWTLPPADAEAGRALFGERCASCHGEWGEGRHAPQLANVAFREAATDEFLAATIALGRPVPRCRRSPPAASRSQRWTATRSRISSPSCGPCPAAADAGRAPDHGRCSSTAFGAAGVQQSRQRQPEADGERPADHDGRPRPAAAVRRRTRAGPPSRAGTSWPARRSSLRGPGRQGGGRVGTRSGDGRQLDHYPDRDWEKTCRDLFTSIPRSSSLCPPTTPTTASCGPTCATAS